MLVDDLNAQIKELSKQNQVLKETLARNKKEEHNFLMLTLNTMGDPVFVKDAESRLLLVNDAFCEIFKLQRKDIIGKTLAENVPLEERESFLAIDKQVIKDGVENINEESLTVEEGNTHFISTKKSRFTDKEQKHYLVGIIRDVTTRVKAERALQDKQEELKQLIETKDRMFSIIAHDLRGPMGSLIGLSDLLRAEEDDLDDMERKEYINLIYSTVVSTKALLDNLLNWANSQRGNIKINKQQLLLFNCVEEIVDTLKNTARNKAIQIENRVSKDFNLVSDKEMLSTIIRNLISNAIKFSYPGGKVEIKAKQNPQNMSISIIDHGVGMTEEQCAELFSIHHNSTRGTANEKGSGLGLMLCKEFTEKLGGEISVVSKPNNGSRFNLNFPLTSEE